MPVRPLRVKAQNELGKTCSLPDDPTAFVSTGCGRPHIFLGLGPRPEILQEMAGHPTTVFYVEYQPFADQMSSDWRGSIPAHYHKIEPKNLTPDLLQAATTWEYTPNQRLFPSFWGPLLAKLHLEGRHASATPFQTVAFLPQSKGGLIVPEIARALGKKQIRPIMLPDNLPIRELAALLTRMKPQLYLSVNLTGLDPFGERFYLLREAGVPVVAWLVDNPFHLLSKLKAPYWKEMPLCVTDDWFIPPLKKLGAHPFHLPLATDPSLFAPNAAMPESRTAPEVTFVGRSAFPHKKGFFAGLTRPQHLCAQAVETLKTGRNPDFSWWLSKLGITNLWPAKDVRQAGLGAEESSVLWRIACLDAAAKCSSLTIVGDNDWQNHVRHPFSLHPPIDYYGPLAAWYQQASITLNMTSLLLPHGLTQRHFDVWAAGGFLLTDSSPGLTIFPDDLTREVTFIAPKDLPPLIQRFAQESIAKKNLQKAWQNEILEHHTYVQRIEKILELTKE